MLVFNKDSCYVFYYLLLFLRCCTNTHTHTHTTYKDAYTEQEAKEPADTEKRRYGSKPVEVNYPYEFRVLKL